MARAPQEAFVVGSGPNGLTAAITLARAGVRVTVLEAQATLGGGCRSAELTLPGYTHDVCSAVHPFAASSPVFQSMPLREYGLEWIQPPVPLAHPLDGGLAALAARSLADTCDGLGADARIYRQVMQPLIPRWRDLITDTFAPPHIPLSPFLLARFGMFSAGPAESVARMLFRTAPARALYAGMAAHSVLPLDMAGSSAFGMMLSLSAHAVGWPIARGGSQNIASALIGYLEALGGKVLPNHPVKSLRDVPSDAAVLCDITPRQLLGIAADNLPDRYCRQLERFRYGPGVFKIDWALSAPIPWQNERCREAGSLHLGGTLEEIASSEKAAWVGDSCSRPFVLLSQPTLFDTSRAPEGKHTAWAYCHVPHGSTEDKTFDIEAQVERFAPGFRKIILARKTASPAQLESYNANLIGGSVGGGSVNLAQLFFRPTPSLYRTPLERLFLCSASTPPGGGVHGMCGYYAAKAALPYCTGSPS